MYFGASAVERRSDKYEIASGHRCAPPARSATGAPGRCMPCCIRGPGARPGPASWASRLGPLAYPRHMLPTFRSVHRPLLSVAVSYTRSRSLPPRCGQPGWLRAPPSTLIEDKKSLPLPGHGDLHGGPFGRRDRAPAVGRHHGARRRPPGAPRRPRSPRLPARDASPWPGGRPTGESGVRRLASTKIKVSNRILRCTLYTLLEGLSPAKGVGEVAACWPAQDEPVL